MLFDKPEKATKYSPKAGETLKSIATGRKLNPEHLAIYNWGSADKVVVARALIEQMGVPFDKLDKDKPFEAAFDGKEKLRAKGELLIPAVYTSKDLALEKTHTLKVKKPKLAPAVGITELDKWFVPGEKGDGIEGEECVVKYTLSGSDETADKLFFEVYASNYAEVEIDDKGVVKFTKIDDPKPVWSEEIAKDKMAARDGTEKALPKYTGKCNAAAGALKPRAQDKPKYLNAAFSPYTCTLRFFKDDADKEAYIDLQPFWPVFESDTKPAKPASLEIKWKVKKTDKLKQGQLIIYDKDNKVICQRTLKEDQLKKDAEGKFLWDGKLADSKPITKKGAPYRVQIQAHSEPLEAKGVAIAAMHTEVRLFVHPKTGEHKTVQDRKLKPWSDPNSLIFKLSKPAAKAPDKGAEEDRWVSYQLHEKGYHPGPLVSPLGASAKMAVAEFKRSNPKGAANNYQRLASDDAVDADLKTLLEAPVLASVVKRPMFGKSDRSAYADDDAVQAEFENPAKEMVVWVNDRHYYTSDFPPPDGAGPTGAAVEMGDYRGTMNIGEARVDKDRASINRPALPVQIEIPLLRKTVALDGEDPWAGLGSDDARKKMKAAMAAAVGPLRMDFGFDEIGDDYSVINDGYYDATRVRTLKYTQKVVSDLSVTYDPDKKAYTDTAKLPAEREATKKYYTNAPKELNSKKVGLRPAVGAMDTYYKAVFAGDDDKLLNFEPWKSLDDTTTKSVCTAVHDDVGQDEKNLVADWKGKAGVYLSPSRIAGDGYRYFAQLSLEKMPGGTDNPNKEALKARYPVLPTGWTAAMRNWRRTSYRGYVGWAPVAQRSWNGVRQDSIDLYHCGHVDYTHEGGNPNDWAVNTLIDQATFRNTARAAISDNFFKNQTMNLNNDHPWPFTGRPGFGFNFPGKNMNLSQYYTTYIQGSANGVWNQISTPLIIKLLEAVEKTHGYLRGHLLVEFMSSPSFHLVELKCNTCNKLVTYLHANGYDLRNQPCNTLLPYAGPPPAPVPCAGTMVHNRDSAQTGFPFAALGLKCGATWLFPLVFTGGYQSEIWAHEVGHHRHFEHAPAYPGSTGDNVPVNTAAGYKVAQHDSALNPYYAGDGVRSGDPVRLLGDTDLFKQWSRACMMAYTNNSMPATERIHQYFCGKCVLRNRGWAVEGIADPEGGMLLTDFQLSQITSSGVKVTWRTSKASNSIVDYGPGGLGTNKTNAAATTNHTVNLSGLTASTEYQVRVTSRTADGETTVSRVLVFKTAPIIIGGVVATPAKNAATIVFTTDRPATSRVDYGLSQTLGSNVAGGSNLAHTIQLAGLTADTIYRYKITCTDARGVETSTAIATFRTTA